MKRLYQQKFNNICPIYLTHSKNLKNNAKPNRLDQHLLQKTLLEKRTTISDTHVLSFSHAQCFRFFLLLYFFSILQPICSPEISQVPQEQPPPSIEKTPLTASTESPPAPIAAITPRKRKIKFRLSDKEQTQQTPGYRGRDEIIQPAPIYTDGDSPLALSVLEEEMAKSEELYGKVPYLEELEESIQQTIPDMRLSGHTFSKDPAKRLIVINNTIARENDVIEHRFILKRILPDSIILQSEEALFRIRSK